MLVTPTVPWRVSPSASAKRVRYSCRLTATAPRRREVGREPLHVEQRHPAGPQQPDQPHQGHLRSVPVQVHHRLAREEPADAQAVQPAGQLALLGPGLDAVRPAQLVQAGVGLDDGGRDPPVGAVGAGAGGDDAGKVAIDADGVPAAAASERPGRPERVERDDRRAPPVTTSRDGGGRRAWGTGPGGRRAGSSRAPGHHRWRRGPPCRRRQGGGSPSGWAAARRAVGPRTLCRRCPYRRGPRASGRGRRPGGQLA